MKHDRPRPALPLLGVEWGDFTRLALWLARALPLLAMALAYQWPGGGSLVIDVGARSDRAYLSSFYAGERSTDPAPPSSGRARCWPTCS